MSDAEKNTIRRVLIASANPLFGKGLEKIILRRWGVRHTEIRLVSSTVEMLAAMETWSPALVIVDYDDKTISRAEFLQKFVSGDQPMQVMLVSLQASGAVVVYDRRTLSPAQVEDWLSLTQVPQAVDEEIPLPRRRASMKHFVIVAILIVIVTAMVYLFLTNIGLLPEAASAQAKPIDDLFNLHFFMISLLFSLITVFLGYSLVVFRRKPGEEGDGVHIRGNNPLEVIWTVIPLGIVIYFAYLGSVSLAETKRVDPQAMEVKVVGGQWFWRFEYPDYGIASNVMYLPVDKQVLLKMTSVDVIHSFWVPEFRVKQDLLPGENLVRELRITPTIIGEYKVRCAEMCGTQHAYMESPVVVVSQADFDAWIQAELEAIGTDPVTRGERWSRNNGCLSCHSVDGTPNVGPTWLGLYGSSQELTDGSVVTVDDDYLYISIVDPNAQIPVGFPPGVMPQNYQDTIPEQQIREIIEYIKSLQ